LKNSLNRLLEEDEVKQKDLMNDAERRRPTLQVSSPFATHVTNAARLQGRIRSMQV
jgi:hypothetical protein